MMSVKVTPRPRARMKPSRPEWTSQKDLCRALSVRGALGVYAPCQDNDESWDDSIQYSKHPDRDAFGVCHGVHEGRVGDIKETAIPIDLVEEVEYSLQC